MKNVAQDMKFGKLGEQRVSKYLCETFNGHVESTNNTNTHDVIMEFAGIDTVWNGRKHIEVKTDKYVMNDVGNLFIEFYCNYKDSGIRVTKSDMYIYYFILLNEIWAIDTKKLKYIVENDKLEVKSGGDDMLAFGYILPRSIYKTQFKIYKI